MVFTIFYSIALVYRVESHMDACIEHDTRMITEKLRNFLTSRFLFFIKLRAFCSTLCCSKYTIRAHDKVRRYTSWVFYYKSTG